MPPERIEKWRGLPLRPALNEAYVTGGPYLQMGLPLLLYVLVAAAVIQTPGADGRRARCDYGTEPGVWVGKKYETLSRGCRLVRYVDHIANKTSQREVSGEILVVGDSLGRNLVLHAGGELGVPVDDYTPIPINPEDPSKPEKIGRNTMIRLGSLFLANLFHFGAHERENHWMGLAHAGIAGMHNTTYGRICLDGPRHLKPKHIKKDPYMIIINSNYWDAMHHSFSTVGTPPKKNRSLPRGPNGLPVLAPEVTNSGGTEAAWEGQVMDTSADPNITALVTRFVDDARDLVDMVRLCYPGTKLFCWYTSPSIGTDSRNPHWFDKRPHVVAALNAAGRFVAHDKDLCLLDWDTMFQGRNGEAEWVPDWLHPASHVSREFVNVVINAMMSHKGQHHGAGDREAELINALSYEHP